MQIKKPQLQRQQVIMAKLGFYKGVCEGIWGPESIAAKSTWETDPSYIPALPSNGLPLGDRDPLPKGVSFDKNTRLFVLQGLTEEEIEKYTKPRNVSQPSSEEPKKEKEEESETEKQSEPVIPSPEQNNQQQNNQHFGKHKKKK